MLQLNKPTHPKPLPGGENKNPHQKSDGDVACIFLLDKGLKVVRLEDGT